MKRTILSMLLILLFSLTITGCAVNEAFGGSTGEEDSPYMDLEPVTMIGADNTGIETAGQMLGELVAEKVSEITDGKFTIQYYPNGEYGEDSDLLSLQEENEIQIVVCQPAPLVEYVPDMAVFDMPMLFSKYNGDTINDVLNDHGSLFYKTIEESYESANLHLLGILQNATYRLTTSNTELNSLSDFENLKIRTMENDNHEGFWKALGADPIPMEWGEVYLALKANSIDAQENAADTIIGAYLNEVQRYLSCTNHILYANQISINNEAYHSLDPLYQEALDQAVEEAIEEIRPQLADIDAENKQILVDNGMTLIEYDNAFFDEVTQLDEVQKLNDEINESIHGLGYLLKRELEKATK